MNWRLSHCHRGHSGYVLPIIADDEELIGQVQAVFDRYTCNNSVEANVTEEGKKENNVPRTCVFTSIKIDAVVVGMNKAERFRLSEKRVCRAKLSSAKRAGMKNRRMTLHSDAK